MACLPPRPGPDSNSDSVTGMEFTGDLRTVAPSLKSATPPTCNSLPYIMCGETATEESWMQQAYSWSHPVWGGGGAGGGGRGGGGGGGPCFLQAPSGCPWGEFRKRRGASPPALPTPPHSCCEKMGQNSRGRPQSWRAKACRTGPGTERAWECLLDDHILLQKCGKRNRRALAHLQRKWSQQYTFFISHHNH